MIAVIGTGRMGRALAGRLGELGEATVFGSRDPDSEASRGLKTETSIDVLSISDACLAAGRIVLAVPYAGLDETLAAMKNATDKTVIDVTNALKMGSHGLMDLASSSSAGEEIQKALPDAKVVKAFNTVGFHIIANPNAAGGPVSSLLAGNNPDAMQEVASLVTKMGLEPVDTGPIRQSRFLEGMAAIYLTPYLQGRMGDAFEYHLRSGAAPTKSSGVRAAS